MTDKTDEQICALSIEKYRQRANTYDSSCGRTWTIRERTIEALHLLPGQCALDVGCGTGLSLSMLHRGVGDSGRVYGFDQSLDMLAIATKRKAEAGWQNVFLQNSSAQSLILPEKVDALLFHYTHDVLRSPAALTRLLSCAKPHAQIAIAGLKYFPKWLFPLNIFVYLKNHGYNGAPGDLSSPWDRIQPHLMDWKLTSTQLGMGYIATGKVKHRVYVEWQFIHT